MSRILYFVPDIVFRPSSAEHLLRIKEMSISSNSCNRMFLDGCLSHLWNDGNEISFRTPGMTPSDINGKFDRVVFPVSNLFNRDFIGYLKELSAFFRQLKVPTYVIGIGCQAALGADAKDFPADVAQATRDFVSAVRLTGGDLTVRGDYTAEVLRSIGCGEVFVSGCPSMYQFGRGLRIENARLKDSEVKPLLNGADRDPNKEPFVSLFRRYPESVWEDQGGFLEMFLGGVRAFRKVRSLAMYRMVREKRVVLFGELPQWRRWMKESGFNFSFGKRIHGNFNAILAGIPACVWACDSRVLELARFFDVPYVTEYHGEPLSDICAASDYTRFNTGFPARYDRFMAWFREHGLVQGEPDREGFHRDFYSYGEPPLPQIKDITPLKWAFSRMLPKGKLGYPAHALHY